MSETLFVLGTLQITFGHVLLALAAAFGAWLLAALLPGDGRRARAREAALQARLDEMARVQSELGGRLQTVAEVFGSRQMEMTRALGERIDTMSHRLGSRLEGGARQTSDDLAKLAERLAVIDAAQANITHLSSQVVTLQEILSNKQTRGAFGQGRMEAIVADGLPASAYDFQWTLTNKRRPDCVIRIPGQAGLICIDAKFPLEAYNALRAAESDEAARAAATRLRQDMARHIADIAERYLVPGETQDTAIMFVPSESIYAELHETFDDVIQRAYRARVVIVSPSLLMLSVQVMQSVLKDVRMREQAGLIQKEVGHLMADMRRLRERVLNLQRHFGQASDDIGQIVTSVDKIGRRADRIEALELDDGDVAGEVVPRPRPHAVAGE